MIAKILKLFLGMLKKNPMLAVDVILDNNQKILLVKRRFWPYRNFYALPGGLVEKGETLEQAAKREVLEETGIKIFKPKLFAVYSNPKRDPRYQVVSIVYYATKFKGKAKTSLEAKEARWLKISEIGKLKLAFDHNKIISQYAKWKYGKPKKES